jgi:NADH-quinone oxidoreductase subunit N
MISLLITNLQVSVSTFNDQFNIDLASTFFKILLVLSTLGCALISLRYLEYKKVNSFEYFVLILLALLGMFCLVSSNELLILYVSIELMSLSFYILAAYKRNSEFSCEAGLKYFILGAFSSGLLLFGISMLYGFTGLSNIEEISRLLTGMNSLSNSECHNGILIGIFFISVSLLFKIAATPFHMWAPDVYEGSPTPVTALFSTVPKIAIFSLLLKLFYFAFYDYIYFWQPFFLYCALLSMIVGSLGALYQKKVKRLMAYSGIANVGYMLAGFAGGSVESVYALIFYLIIYVITTICFFSFLLGLHTQKDSKLSALIVDFTDLGKINPVLAFSVCLILFSMLGLPPLVGFFGKFYLFLVMIQSKFYFIAISGILLSVVAAFYYIRLIKIMFFERFLSCKVYSRMCTINAYVLSYILFFIVFLFSYPHPFLTCIHKISLDLCL